MARVRRRGRAPIEAMSLIVTAIAIHPICQSVIPAGKSVVSWSISVDMTGIPVKGGRTAQSSEQASYPRTGMILASSPRSSTLSHLSLPFCQVLPEQAVYHLLLPASPEYLKVMLPVCNRLFKEGRIAGTQLTFSLDRNL